MSLSQLSARVPNIFFIGVLLLLTVNKNMRLVSAAPVILYEDTHFKGKTSRFQLGDTSTCINLVGKQNDFHSSVDTIGTCLLLCEHLNCRGKCARVSGKLQDFSLINLNDQVSSIRKCDNETSTVLARQRRKNKKKQRSTRTVTRTPPTTTSLI